MALDTKDKRLSTLNVMQPWEINLPTPSGIISQEDRQQILSGYSGILWLVIDPVNSKIVRHMYKYDGDKTIIAEKMADASRFIEAEGGEAINLRLASLDVMVVNSEDLVSFKTSYDSVSGAIALPSSSSVIKGKTVIFQVVLPDGYKLKRWLRNSVEISRENPAEIKIIKDDTSIYAELETI